MPKISPWLRLALRTRLDPLDGGNAMKTEHLLQQWEGRMGEWLAADVFNDHDEQLHAEATYKAFRNASDAAIELAEHIRELEVASRQTFRYKLKVYLRRIIFFWKLVPVLYWPENSKNKLSRTIYILPEWGELAFVLRCRKSELCCSIPREFLPDAPAEYIHNLFTGWKMINSDRASRHRQHEDHIIIKRHLWAKWPEMKE